MVREAVRVNRCPLREGLVQVKCRGGAGAYEEIEPQAARLLPGRLKDRLEYGLHGFFHAHLWDERREYSDCFAVDTGHIGI